MGGRTFTQTSGGPTIGRKPPVPKLVVADIVSAVEYAKKSDPNRSAPRSILLALPEGGYTALVMAGHHPEIWAGVSAWVPISDLAAWHAQGKHVEALEQSCGGAPGDSPAVDAEYAKRSPITFLSNAKGTTLHLHAGIKEKIVPISHSLLAFNELAAAKDRIPEGGYYLLCEEEKSSSESASRPSRSKLWQEPTSLYQKVR